jgi:spermidine/putrescine-binding protein
MSGRVGLAYNRVVTGRDINKIDDLWDPAYKGKVSMLSDTQDGLGMIMLSQGSSSLPGSTVAQGAIANRTQTGPAKLHSRRETAGQCQAVSATFRRLG